MKTVTEYAALMRLSISTIYRLIRQGKIDGAVKIGGSWRIK